MADHFRKLQDAEIYLEDKTLLGMAKEVDCGTIEYSQSTHSPLGGIGEFDMSGKLKAMEGSIHFESLFSEVFADLHPNKYHQLQAHSTIDGWDYDGLENQQQLITHLRVKFFKMPVGKFSQGDVTSFESGFKIMAVKQLVDGVNIREIDFINNIDTINGNPVNAPIKK